MPTLPTALPAAAAGRGPAAATAPRGAPGAALPQPASAAAAFLAGDAGAPPRPGAGAANTARPPPASPGGLRGAPTLSVAAGAAHGLQRPADPATPAVPAALVRARLRQLAGYGVANLALIAGSGVLTHVLLGAGGLARHAAWAAAGGMLLPMLALGATRLVPPQRPWLKHGIWLALNVGLGFGMGIVGLWSSAVLLPAVGAVLGTGAALAVAARRSGSPRNAAFADSITDVGMLGLTLGTTYLPALPLGAAAMAVQVGVWALGVGLVVSFFIDKACSVVTQVGEAEHFDAVGASVTLYAPLMSLLVSFCRAAAAARLPRPMGRLHVPQRPATAR